MKRFIARYADKVIGVLSGFDRLVFRGTLRTIAFVAGMQGFLWRRHLLLKEFGPWADGMTQRVEASALRAAQAFDRPIQYLRSSRTDKDEVARAIAKRDEITEGLVAVLTCVEPCLGFDIYRNKDTKHLELVMRQRKCKFIYHYVIDPEVGWMHARIQTWLPFNVQIYVNGREWLSRQMDRAGMTYHREENCFPWVEDLPRAQDLMNQQLRTRWPEFLGRVARRLHPDHAKILPEIPEYYWSTYQSEWASDVMFRDRQSLEEIYPGLVRHGITAFSCRDVMKFFGRKLTRAFDGEIITSLKEREEGVRLKYWVDENSLKLYDKGSVLRPETTIQNPRPFRTYRAKEGDPHGPKQWRSMRAGVADLARRAKVSQTINNRLMGAIAAADTSTPLGKLARQITTPVPWGKARVRGLRPWDSDDLKLLRAVNDGNWNLRGFRNRDLQELLYPTPPESAQDKRSRSARVTRQIRMLRAHGLVQKETGARRYTVTARGCDILTAILVAQDVTLEQLRKVA